MILAASLPLSCYNNKLYACTQCAKLAADLKFDGIDINMGCPDKNVISQGSGIALIQTPKLAQVRLRLFFCQAESSGLIYRCC